MYYNSTLLDKRNSKQHRKQGELWCLCLGTDRPGLQGQAPPSRAGGWGRSEKEALGLQATYENRVFRPRA